jgi:hypothetical protein
VEHPTILVEITMTTMMERTIETTEQMVGAILDVDQPETSTAPRILFDPFGKVALLVTRCTLRDS